MLIFIIPLIIFFILGTVSDLYIVIFVIVHAVKWGPHLHFNVPKDEGPTKRKFPNYILKV